MRGPVGNWTRVRAAPEPRVPGGFTMPMSSLPGWLGRMYPFQSQSRPILACCILADASCNRAKRAKLQRQCGKLLSNHIKPHSIVTAAKVAL